jgi:sigma-E factor negative regulatory protein RseC
MLDEKEKIVEVETSRPGDFKTGDRVIVSMDNNTGLIAVFWGYGLPFIVLIVTLIAVLTNTNNELMAGLSSIVALGIYYLILYVFRRYFMQTYRFYITRQ